MPRVAVVIPVFAGVTDEYAKRCIQSLRATTDWDIIVVSNGSKIRPDFGEVRKSISLHLHTSQQGQCNAVNIGVAAAETAEWILVSNDDMYYAPGWNDQLDFNRFEVFSPNLVEPTNNLGSAPPFQKFDGGFTLDEFKQKEVDEFISEAKQIDEDEPGFNLPFFIRKSLFQEIGGYDVGYDPWGSNSDTDFQTKINLAGITPMRLRDVLVYHFSNKSGTFEDDPVKKAAWQHNWDYFQEKWGFNRDQLKSDVWYNKDMLPKDSEQIKYMPIWAGRYAK